MQEAEKALQTVNIYDPNPAVYKKALLSIRAASMNCYAFEVLFSLQKHYTAPCRLYLNYTLKKQAQSGFLRGGTGGRRGGGAAGHCASTCMWVQDCQLVGAIESTKFGGGPFLVVEKRRLNTHHVSMTLPCWEDEMFALCKLVPSCLQQLLKLTSFASMLLVSISERCNKRHSGHIHGTVQIVNLGVPKFNNGINCLL